jgi:hypothetical protein
MESMNQMQHHEAVEKMAVERYLLDELSPEMRDAFEQHFFDCQECALELRATAAFLDEAKVQLPALLKEATAPSYSTSAAPARNGQPADRPAPKKRNWFAWIWAQPAFAAPAFAALIAIVGYQNIATIPALRLAASVPAVVPWTAVHASTRDADPHTQVLADPKHGANLLVDLPAKPLAEPAYTSYVFEVLDPKGKRLSSQRFAAPANDAGTVSLSIPGSGLQQGAYTLAISAATGSEAPKEIERRVFDIHFAE